MRRVPFLSAVLTLASAAAVVSQTPAPPAGLPPGPVYLVTYLEVTPAAESRTAAVLQRYRQATRREAGSLRVEALQGLHRRSHFALVEAWRDQDAVDAHRGAAHTAALRSAIERDGHAPPDERVLRSTVAGPIAEGVVPRAAVFVLTHADALPPASRGTEVLLPLAEASRREAGNVRFEVLVQAARLNHFTLVEVWRDRQAFDAHAVAPHTRDFRTKFLRVTGALYDERLYTSLR
ncbi:MAG: putative quinol monooxygenase [Vicinamibacterales bacterium]